MRLWPLLTLLSASATARAEGRCESPTTYVEVGGAAPEVPRHDQSLGKTVFVLRSKAGGKELARLERGESWTCLGYSAARGAYLLQGRWEEGSWVMARSLLLWEESSGKAKPSRLDREKVVASWSALGPGGRYLALVGKKAEGKHRLYAYSPADDRLEDLGEPPAPPSLTEAEAAMAEQNGERPGAWSWSESDRLREGGAELEPGLVAFTSESRLEASYGKDTARARAGARTKKAWDLAARPPRPAK